MVDMTLLCPLQSDQECQMVEWVNGVAGDDDDDDDDDDG